ncbi:flavin-containing monooxygenase, partial [Corynespora cassiicola Philippines]
WRDILALSSTMRTFNSTAAFKAAWKDLISLRQPYNFEFEEGSSSVVRIGHIAFITARFHFQNGLQPSGRSLGMLKIAPDIFEGFQDNAEPSRYKIVALSTILESVQGYGDPDVFPRHFLENTTLKTNEILNGASNGTIKSYNSNAKTGGSLTSNQFDALVVGLGPSGLSNIARLKALGLNAIACDKIPEVGLNWTDRYNSLRLHTPKMQNSLPFDFKPPKDANYYLTMEELKNYYQSFVAEYKLQDSLWLSTIVNHATYSKSKGSWTVTLIQAGNERVISARHLVFCVGNTGRVPQQPNLPGRESFHGTVIHSVDYTCATEWAGKRGIVIGTANTGHDVAEDMADAGMHVTMVQRLKTPVLTVPKLPLHKAFHDGVSVTEVDKWFHTNPLAIERVIMKTVFRQLFEQDKEKFDKLDARGFKVDREADLTQILYERAGRHYMDVGVSQMIIDGRIDVKSGVALSEFTNKGLKFADGTELEADIIVFATGYSTDMRLAISKILDPETVNQLDETWRLDEEGNPRGSWKPIGHPNIWFCPGDISHTRFFSRFIALQVKAEVEGSPFVPYER